jgi:hypothetical protein
MFHVGRPRNVPPEDCAGGWVKDDASLRSEIHAIESMILRCPPGDRDEGNTAEA